MTITLIPIEILAQIAWDARANMSAFALSCKRFAECIKHIPKWRMLHYKTLRALPKMSYVETPSRTFKLTHKDDEVHILFSLGEDFNRKRLRFSEYSYERDTIFIKLCYIEKKRRVIICRCAINGSIPVTLYCTITKKIGRCIGNIMYRCKCDTLREAAAQEMSVDDLLTSYDDAMKLLSFIKY